MQDGFINAYTVCVFLPRAGRLTWHDVIPSDEVWIKLGGNKGGGTFKKSFQIVNVPSPNFSQNTCVCCFEAYDNVSNFHVALDHFKIRWKNCKG